MVKPRSKQAKAQPVKQPADDQAIAALADQMADRPYESDTDAERMKDIEKRLAGAFGKTEAEIEEKWATETDQPVAKSDAATVEPEKEELERITISLPRDMRYKLEDMARDRKRAKQPGRSVSAIVREALDAYL